MSKMLQTQYNGGVKTNPWPIEFQWIAVLKDGKVIEQFPSDSEETNFRTILEKQEDLLSLSIVHWTGDISIDVNLESGTIYLNRKLPFYPVLDGDPITGAKFRPIMFRRVRQHMRSDGSVIGKETTYYAGWQATIGGRNVKRIFSIMPDGRIGVE